MEIQTLTADFPISKNSRSSDCTLLGFDLPSLISTMKQSFTWANGELKTMILLKSPDVQIILAAMQEGTEILSFQSNDSINIEIIEGRLMFHIRKDAVTLNKGQSMVLDEKIKYRLTTGEETAFLLTISNTTSKPTSN